jgi:chitinase
MFSSVCFSSGSLRLKTQEWLLGSATEHCNVNCCGAEIQLLKNLQDFPERFTSSQYLVDGFLSLDDEDLDAWESESKRWARALFLIIKGEDQQAPILRVCHLPLSTANSDCLL